MEKKEDRDSPCGDLEMLLKDKNRPADLPHSQFTREVSNFNKNNTPNISKTTKAMYPINHEDFN